MGAMIFYNNITYIFPLKPTFVKERIGSFSFDVILRILSVLHENGNLNRTNLSLKAKLHYSVCQKYIELLELLSWVRNNRIDPSAISLTNEGRQVSELLFHNLHTGRTRGTSGDGNEMTDNSKAAEFREIGKQDLYNLKIHSQTRLASGVRSGTNVMLVEDEELLSLTYQSFLTSAGYNVESFSNGSEALQRFSEDLNYFSLIILDIRLPDINGIMLYKMIEALNPDCKVIFVSALDAAKELVSVLPNVSPTQILKKPVDKDIFVKTVIATIH